MTPVRTTCPYCGELTQMAPAEIVLALTADRATGDYAYTCPQCLRTGAHTADEITVASLLSAGVIPVPVDNPPTTRLQQRKSMTNADRTEQP